eukprot:6685774-Pyramimonas_sp.AAC.1
MHDALRNASEEKGTSWAGAVYRGLTTDQSDSGSSGIFSRRTNRAQGTRPELRRWRREDRPPS